MQLCVFGNNICVSLSRKNGVHPEKLRVVHTRIPRTRGPLHTAETHAHPDSYASPRTESSSSIRLSTLREIEFIRCSGRLASAAMVGKLRSKPTSSCCYPHVLSGRLHRPRASLATLPRGATLLPSLAADARLKSGKGARTGRATVVEGFDGWNPKAKRQVKNSPRFVRGSQQR